VVGRRDEEVFPSDLCDALRVGEEEALFAGGIVHSEEEILANGEPRTLLWVRDVLHDADGHPIGILGTATDITARKTAERMIREVNQKLEERVRQRTQALQKAQAEMLTRLGRAAEYRDDATGEHIGRMSLTCSLIARAAGLRPTQCEMIALASQMHDIGKIGIPDCILLKPGPLTEDERTVMRTHTVIGAGLLSGGTTPLIQLAEAIARDHHERWDGTGYPRGLIGEQIPLAARITAIADVFDALTSERPYKRAWTVKEAAEEILRQSGRMFDPRLVAAFLSVLDQVPLAAPEPGFRRAG
jgi:putative two-component system response regulator